MQQAIFAGVAIVAIVAGAIYEGRYSERWSPRETSAEQQVYAARLMQVPKVIGEWEAKDAPMDPQQLEMAHVIGHISRVYTNKRTHEEVSIFIVSGEPRDIAVHTPDQCYISAGFRMVDEAQHYTLTEDGREANFYTTSFLKQDVAHSQNLKIYWSWNLSGAWIAPAVPRVSLVGGPSVFKLYAIQQIVDPAKQDGTLIEFLRQLVPALDTTLFPPAEAPHAVAAG